ncbi:MAG: hypothetical protein AB1546_04960 [bacterium]
MERDMSFFKNVFQVDGLFGGEPAKVPVFYYDATAITGIFFARMSVLKRFMPKKTYFPSSVCPGIGAIAITCFQYRDTDIQPYNEISISIPMTYRSHCPIPSAALISGLRRNEFNVYIHRLPVTTKIALDGGVIVYNYPKFLSSIDFEEKDGETVVTLAENGEFILRVFAKKIPAGASKVYRYVTYPVKDDCAQHADVLLYAKKFGQTFNPKTMRIELGEKHEMAKELKRALLWRRPMLYQYIPEFQSILYGPSRLE